MNISPVKGFGALAICAKRMNGTPSIGNFSDKWSATKNPKSLKICTKYLYVNPVNPSKPKH